MGTDRGVRALSGETGSELGGKFPLRHQINAPDNNDSMSCGQASCLSKSGSCVPSVHRERMENAQMARLAIMPEIWLTHPEVGADEIAVLAALSLHANKEGTCYPSQGLLAQILNRSRPWVNKVVSRLVEIGVIERTHQTRRDGGERACLYRLIGRPPESKLKSPCPAPLESTSESTQSRQPDRVSQSRDSACHGDDSLKTDYELKQESHPASATINSQGSQEILPPRIAAVYSPLNPINHDITSKPSIPNSDWQPTDADLIYLLERFPEVPPDTITGMTERFILRSQAKGYSFLDISAGWRSWLTDDIKKANDTSQRHNARTSASQTKFDAWASVAARASMRAYHA